MPKGRQLDRFTLANIHFKCSTVRAYSTQRRIKCVTVCVRQKSFSQFDQTPVGRFLPTWHYDKWSVWSVIFAVHEKQTKINRKDRDEKLCDAKCSQTSLMPCEQVRFADSPIFLSCLIQRKIRRQVEIFMLFWQTVNFRLHSICVRIRFSTFFRRWGYARIASVSVRFESIYVPVPCGYCQMAMIYHFILASVIFFFTLLFSQNTRKHNINARTLRWISKWKYFSICNQQNFVFISITFGSLKSINCVYSEIFPLFLNNFHRLKLI